jgi:hypothetical protein
MKNFQVGKLTLDPGDLAIWKCLQSDLAMDRQTTDEFKGPQITQITQISVPGRV